MANYYLKSLGIIHWRLRESKNTMGQPLIYALVREDMPCVYLTATVKTAAETELFNKIAAASALSVVEASQDQLLAASLPVLVFGPSSLGKYSVNLSIA